MRAVKGWAPQIVSLGSLDQFVCAQPCELFAEFFLRTFKRRYR